MRTLPSVLAACVPIALAALAGCASLGHPPGPEGDRRLYEAKCGQCHVPFHRDDYTPSQWPGIVAQFGPRAGLTSVQRQRILAYLTRAEAPPAPSD